MPPNPPSNSRLPRLAVWSGYGTGGVTNFSLEYIFLYLKIFILIFVDWNQSKSNSNIQSQSNSLITRNLTIDFY